MRKVFMTSNDVEPSPPENVILIPIWGQSNASGHGMSASDLPSYLVGPIPHVLIYNWNLSTSAYQNLEVGVNNNRNNGVELNPNWFGPEMELGYRMWQQFGGIIYLVKVSEYATPMYSTGGTNDWNATTSGGLCEQFIAQIVAARNNLIAAGKTVLIKAMYGMQGESDADTSAHALAYESNRIAFYNKVKSDLGLTTLYDVFGRIRSALPPFSSTVYSQQTQYQADDSANRFLVDTDAYPTTDGLHYTGAAQITQGHAAFDVIKTFY